MKVEVFNFKAGMLGAFGILGTVIMTLMTLVLGANIASGAIAGWVLATTVILWVTIEGFRNVNHILEYDAAGIRSHSIGGWDVPWEDATMVTVADDLGERRLVVDVIEDQVPSAARGWFGAGAGQRSGNRVVPYPVKKRPRPPKGAAVSSGPRAVSSVWRMRRPMLAAIGAALLAGAMLTMMVGQWSLGVGFLLAVIGLTGGYLTAAGAPRRRSIAVVDSHGIRQVGQKHWTMPWERIASAQIVANTLLVTPIDAPDQADGQIQDSFQVDDEDDFDDDDDDDDDESDRRRGRGRGLAGRVGANARLRAALEDSDLTTAPIAKQDVVAMQQMIDHYQSTWRQGPAAVGTGPDPASWPIAFDKDESEVQDEYQPRAD